MRVAPRLLQHTACIVALMAALMVAVTLIAGEGRMSWGFVAAGLGGAALALICRWLASTGDDFSTGETMATVALAWAMAALLGAIPFVVAAVLNPGIAAVEVFADPVNALFESVSGFTSTGLTMVERPAELPHSLQFWRTLMEWIGGIGLALLAIALMNPETDHDDLFSSELNKPFGNDSRRMVLEIWAIYGVLTIFGIGLFWLLGMPLWQSLNHGMTAIATGGFAVTNDSFGAYSAPLQSTAVLLTILGAMSFAAYHEAWRQRNPLLPLKRGPILFVLAGIAVATGLLWLSRLHFESDGGLMSFVFQTTSAFGTAGFATVSLSDWHSAPLAVLILCMVIGGASGATTGGVKSDRILLICRGIGWRLERVFGRADRRVRINGEEKSQEQARIAVESAATLVSIWMLTALLGCLMLAPIVGDDWSFTQIGFEVMSALGSVGLSVGITGPDMPTSGKWILAGLMWMGRLELFAVLALLWMPIMRLRVAGAAVSNAVSNS